MIDVVSRPAPRAPLAASLLARLRALPAPTPRERAAIACAVAVGCICAAWIAGDWRVRAADSADEAGGALARLQTLMTGDFARPASDILAAGAERAALWSIVEPSPGLAKAHVAQSLETMAREAGLANIAITPIEDERGRNAGATARAPARKIGRAEAVSPLTVILDAEGDWASFMTFLDALARSETGYRIEAIDRAEGDDRPGALSVTLRVAHLRRDAPQ